MLVPTFTLTALATVAHASANHIAHPAHVNRDLVPRQTIDAGVGAACASDLLSIAASIPTPPAALLEGEFATITDPCSYSVPTSIASDYSAYSSELLSWASVNEPKLSSALAKCPELAAPIAEASNSLLCSTSPPVLGGGATAPAPTGSAGGSGSGSGSGSGAGGSGSTPTGGSGSTPTGGSGSNAGGNTSTAGGPRETGFAVGVMAFAGLVGAVAAL
jgi:hypothetical protein